jgi:hypothetical protein
LPVASQTAAGPRLSDTQLVELIGLIKRADRVELKLTVPESDQRSAVSALEMDPLEAEIRQVYFLDTPDLLLNRTGLVLRVRRSQRQADDSAVKLRPVAPAECPPSCDRHRRSGSRWTPCQADSSARDP